MPKLGERNTFARYFEPSCSLPWRLLILFPVCNSTSSTFIYLQPCYGRLPLLPSIDQTSVVCPLQPLDWSTFKSHNLFFFFPLIFVKLSKDSIRIKMETRLVSAEVKAFSCAPNRSDLIQIVSTPPAPPSSATLPTIIYCPNFLHLSSLKRKNHESL